MRQKFCTTIPVIPFRTKEFGELIAAALPLFGLEEASRCVIPAFRTWFERLRKRATLFFSNPMERFFAGEFTSFSLCRGSF